jgi:hypothetical protein
MQKQGFIDPNTILIRLKIMVRTKHGYLVFRNIQNLFNFFNIFLLYPLSKVFCKIFYILFELNRMCAGFE